MHWNLLEGETEAGQGEPLASLAIPEQVLDEDWPIPPWDPGGQETSSEAKAFALNPHQGSKTPACHQGRVQPMSLKIRAGFALWALSTSGSDHCFGGHCVHFMMLTASQLLLTSGQEQPLPV